MADREDPLECLLRMRRTISNATRNTEGFGYDEFNERMKALSWEAVTLFKLFDEYYSTPDEVLDARREASPATDSAAPGRDGLAGASSPERAARNESVRVEFPVELVEALLRIADSAPQSARSGDEDVPDKARKLLAKARGDV